MTQYQYCVEHRTLHAFQNFWRCAHHPIATANLFEHRNSCEWECHTQPLQWHHSGEHQLPPVPQKRFVPYQWFT